MCTCSHEITIKNLSSGEVISYEFLLIKGKIHSNSLCKINSASADNNKIRVKNLQTNKNVTFPISKSGDFKVLVNLKEDSLNSIELNYCNASLLYKCSHRRPNGIHRILPLYLVCDGHDGSFNSRPSATDQSETGKRNPVEDACASITLGIKLIQTLFAEKLYEIFQVRKTFTLEDNCIPFYAKLKIEDAHKLDENELWNKFAYEIINSKLGENENLKFVAFIGCTKYEEIKSEDFSYENIRKHTKATAALGAGGLALFGSGCLYTWPTRIEEIIPCFLNNEKIDLTRYIDDSNYRRTYSGCFATTLGAVAHEIGHIFDLGHTKDGIMGNDFDYVNHVFVISGDDSNLTENLPNRQVACDETHKNGSSSENPVKDKRLTNLRKNSNFLDKYYTQKYCDGIYFTKNCALILFYHKWFNDNENIESNLHLNVEFNKIEGAIKNTMPNENKFFKLIEIRNKTNGFIKEYYDYTLKPFNGYIKLPKFNYENYDIFIIAENGDTKILE